MSAISEEIREAVRVALADLLPDLIETAMTATAAKLQLGDAGDELIDAGAYGRLGRRSPSPWPIRPTGP